MTLRVSQLVANPLFTPENSARVSQLVVGILYTQNSEARVSQNTVNVLMTNATQLVSQHVANVLYTPEAGVRVSQLLANVLISNIRTSGAIIDVESFKQPTLYREFGFSLSVYDINNNWIENIDIPNGWSHNISANGGFSSARVDLQLSKNDIEEWIDKGIGRRIIFYVDTIPVWEGFVNSLSAKIGPLTYSRGPMMDIGNRVLVMYSPIDMTIDPPTVGDSTPSTIAEDLLSQQKWGIIEKILDAGECTDEDAEMYRNTWLAENSEPLSSKDIALGSGDTGLTLELLGFSAYLQAYTYYNESILFCTATQKIKNVIASDPNAVFSSDYGLMEENAYLVPEGEQDRNKLAESIIKSVVDLGDVNNDRWIFGVGTGRKIYYKRVGASQSDIVYFQRLSDPAQRIYDIAGNIVYPWEVKPGNWIFLLDFMVGRERGASLTYDARAIFIEEVTFSLPWDISYRSSATKKIDQIIAKQGMTRGQ